MKYDGFAGWEVIPPLLIEENCKTYNMYLLFKINSCVNHPVSTSNEGFIKLLALGF